MGTLRFAPRHQNSIYRNFLISNRLISQFSLLIVAVWPIMQWGKTPAYLPGLRAGVF